MKGRSHSAGQKIPIEFDTYWKPIGPNARRYKDFVSEVAHKEPSILIEKWKNIDAGVKQRIWDTIQLTYDVPESDKLYKKTMTYCGERWTKFKTNLAKKNVHIKVKDGEPLHNPCSKYSYLDEETWQEFCRIRTTPEALKKREKAQEIGRKNVCPHLMSRGGYEKAEKELMAAKRKRLEEEAQSNPSVLVSPPSPISREEKWLYARQKRSGSYTSEQTRIIAEQIEEPKKKQDDGSFVVDGRNDILTVATGKHEHPGRVRGVGGGVGIRDYYGSSKRHSSSKVTREEMEHMLATVREETRAKVKAEVEASFDAIMEALLSKVEASFDAIMEAQLSKMKDEMMKILNTRLETNVKKEPSNTVKEEYST